MSCEIANLSLNPGACHLCQSYQSHFQKSVVLRGTLAFGNWINYKVVVVVERIRGILDIYLLWRAFVPWYAAIKAEF